MRQNVSDGCIVDHMTPQRKTQNNGPIIDDWTEYKRLVLSELERLDQAVEKLKDQCIEIQSYIQTEISAARERLGDKINNLDKDHPTHEQISALKNELDELEKRFLSYSQEQQVDTSIASKWGLWTAVISIIGSLIVSIVSLVVALT